MTACKRLYVLLLLSVVAEVQTNERRSPFRLSVDHNSSTCGLCPGTVPPTWRNGWNGRGALDFEILNETCHRMPTKLRHSGLAFYVGPARPASDYLYPWCPSWHEAADAQLLSAAGGGGAVPRALSAAFAALDQLGLTVSITGPPGSGKTTILTLASLFGFHAKDLEGFPRSERWSAFIKVEQQNRRSGRAVLVSHIERANTNVSTAIRIALLPSAVTYAKRWRARDAADPQRHRLSLEGPSEAFTDVVVKAEGCAEQTLLDVAVGALGFAALTGQGDSEEGHGQAKSLSLSSARRKAVAAHYGLGLAASLAAKRAINEAGYSWASGSQSFIGEGGSADGNRDGLTVPAVLSRRRCE